LLDNQNLFRKLIPGTSSGSKPQIVARTLSFLSLRDFSTRIRKQRIKINRLGYGVKCSKAIIRSEITRGLRISENLIIKLGGFYEIHNAELYI